MEGVACVTKMKRWGVGRTDGACWALGDMRRAYCVARRSTSGACGDGRADWIRFPACHIQVLPNDVSQFL